MRRVSILRRLLIPFLLFVSVALTQNSLNRANGALLPTTLYAAAPSPSIGAQFLTATDGGMAQYGYAIQQSSSLSQTLQAVANWNAYINPRSEWNLTSTLVDRVAVAEWNARLAGSPTITAEQLAAAATNLINAKLNTMTAQEQVLGFRQMMVQVTPKSSYALNPGSPYISGTENADGTWTVTVDALAFSERKNDLAAMAPGMVSSYANFYPAEAILVLYSVASGDMGYGGEYDSKVRKAISDLTGLDMANRSLYGENGYRYRRPLTSFLTEQSTSQLFSELGF